MLATTACNMLGKSASSVLQPRLGFEVFDHKVLTKQCFKQGYMGKDSVLSSRRQCLEM